MSFGNLKIGARLGSGFASILMLLAFDIGMCMNQIVDNHNAKILGPMKWRIIF